MILSLVAQLDFANALNWGIDFLKVVLYYVLFVGLVDSPARLRTFLFWMLVFATDDGLPGGAPVPRRHHPAQPRPDRRNVQGPRDRAGDVHFVRLTGSGIFHDPNELGVLIAVLIVLGLYWLTDRRSGHGAVLWVGPLVLFLYAMSLTQSRGALLALLAGLAVLLVARFGWRIAALVGVVVRAGAAAVPGGPADRPLDRATAPPRTASRSGATA